MTLPRYPEYRDSGVSWLGPMPAHWSCRRYKQVFAEQDERSEHGNELLLSVSAYTGVSPRSEIIDEGDHLSRAESLEGYKVCYPDDLVMNIMLAWNRGLGFSQHHGIVSPAYSVFRPQPGNSPKFLDYMVRSDRVTLYFKAFSSGVIESRLRLYSDAFGSLFCVLPPLDEQIAIATFLDRETAKIDALIAEQEKLIALLAEKRQATISHAVTRGLNPNAPMKDSGVPWLGEVPAHWSVSRVKALSVFTTSGPRGWSERLTEEGSLFIQSGDLNDSLGLEYETAKRVSVGDDAEAERTRLAEGDVVVCITGAKTGNVAVCSALLEPAFVNQHLCLIRPAADVDGRFLAFALKASGGQLQLELAQYGLKQGLSLENVREVWVARPPHDEQKEIVLWLDAEMERFSSLAAAADAGVTLLRERRSALIAAAVTGQIDVRGLVAPPKQQETLAA